MLNPTMLYLHANVGLIDALLFEGTDSALSVHILGSHVWQVIFDMLLISLNDILFIVLKQLIGKTVQFSQRGLSAYEVLGWGFV